MKECPFCKAKIEDNARFCLYCMSSLNQKEVIPAHKRKKPQWSLVVAAIAALLLAVMLLPEGQTEEPTPSESQHLNSVPSSKPTEISSTPETKPSSQPITQPTSQVTSPETQPTQVTTPPATSGKPTQPTTVPTQPTTQPTTRPTTQPTTQPTQPTTQPTQPTTQPATEPITVPTGPHEHVYYVKNTDEKYLIYKAACTRPAIYCYSCPCGEAGTTTFTYGEAAGHNYVYTPAIAPTCASYGKEEGEYCIRCGLLSWGRDTIQKLDHSYGQVGEYIACLACGRFAEGQPKELVLLLPEFPYVRNNTLRIESCTYEIGNSTINENWLEIRFYVEFTNISSEAQEIDTILKLQLFSTGAGRVTAEPTTVLPGEQGSYQVLFPSIPHGRYEVLFEWQQ